MDTTILSGIMGLAGALIGAFIASVASYRASISATNKSIAEQRFILEQSKLENRAKEEIEIKQCARIVDIDIFTAILEGYSVLNQLSRKYIGHAPICIAYNHNYCENLAKLSKFLSPVELHEINTIYGIIQKINADILKLNYVAELYHTIEFDYNILYIRLFGDKFKEVLQDINTDSYDKMIDKMEEHSRNALLKITNLAKE